MRAMASRSQKTILHGNWSDAAGTLNNEVGPYDDDSFDGLRKILNTVSAVNVDPATNPATTGSISNQRPSTIRGRPTRLWVSRLPMSMSGPAGN